MPMVIANTAVTSSVVPAVKVGSQRNDHFQHFDGRRIQNKIATAQVRLSLKLPHVSGRRSVLLYKKKRLTSLICAAAFNSRCSASGQTQTIQAPTQVYQKVPVKDEMKSPELDDGGAGFPPRDDGDGGGGGGGGGGNFSGGFFLFGFLAFLGFLKDKESEENYRDGRR